MLSFMKGRKTETPPSGPGGKASGAPALRNPVLTVLEKQKGHATTLIDGGILPKMKGSTKTVSTWFYKKPDGSYGTRIRYGQQSIPIDGAETGVHVGKLEDLSKFYDDVAASINKGEMDALLLKMQTRKSDDLNRARKTAKEAARLAAAKPEAETRSEAEAQPELEAAQ
jgi:hypothetical protein